MKAIIVLILLAISLSCLAQGKKIKNLAIGEKVPDYTITNLYGSNKATSLSNYYQGKLLLIDFWATWCSPCVKALSKLDSLKRVFNNKLEVIAVTQEKKQTIEKFLNKRSELRNLNLNIITNDTLLSLSLRHRIIPHIAWIDSLGKVISITHSEDVNYENIYDYFTGNPINVRLKRDVLDFKAVEYFNTSDSSIVYRSLLSKARPDLPGGTFVDKAGAVFGSKIKRFFAFNASIKDLYMIAAYSFSVPRNNEQRIILEVRDTIKYIWPNSIPEVFKRSKYKTRAQWVDENIYCYELIVPQETDYEDFYKYMLSDLNRFWGVTGTIEKRNIPCFLLVDKSNSLPLKSPSSNVKKFKNSSPGIVSAAYNMTIMDIVSHINRFNNNKPLINETSNLSPADWDIYINTNDENVNLSTLRKTFEKYDIDIIEGYRPMDVLVLRERR
jgi:thiol-disulfide isomerase/thioredoxin